MQLFVPCLDCSGSGPKTKNCKGLPFGKSSVFRKKNFVAESIPKIRKPALVGGGLVPPPTGKIFIIYSDRACPETSNATFPSRNGPANFAGESREVSPPESYHHKNQVYPATCGSCGCGICKCHFSLLGPGQKGNRLSHPGQIGSLFYQAYR